MIKDKDLSSALDTVAHEIEVMEEYIATLEKENDELGQLNYELTDKVDDLTNKIKKLEEALAESYLVSTRST